MAVHHALLLEREQAVLHGFSGALPAGDERAQALRLRRWLEGQLRRELPPPLLLAQPHGTAIVDASTLPPGAPGEEATQAPPADGADSAAPAAPLLVVKSADCVPVLAVDSALERCAALHAGWRGVAAGILPALLRRWKSLGSSLRTVRLAFGPHIRSCCFEVQQDCVQAFNPADLSGALETRGSSRYIALEAVLRRQAAGFGIAPEQIEALPYCTVCARGPDSSPLFASYRRSGRMGAPVGRNLSFITFLPRLSSRQ